MQKTQTQKRKRTSPGFRSTTETTSAITNNTDADIVVIDVDTAGDLSVEQLYERSLRVLKTVTGKTTIKAGATSPVVLDATTATIIIARADNLFPVKTASIALDGNTQQFPSLEVTAGDAGRMKLAAKFQQMLTAFPTSSVAVDYATALAASDPAQATAFFSSTDDYKTLTVEDVTAVQTYYSIFPFVWAYYGNEKTYGLHATDGISNKYVGYITLTNDGTAPFHGDKPRPNTTITYTKEGVSKKLYYKNGQFIDDVNSDSPGVCLQGLFVLKSSITKSEDDNAIIAVLIGIINGESVLGYDEEAVLQSSGQAGDLLSSLDILQHPDDTKGWLEMAAVILASVLELAVLIKAVVAVANKLSNGDPLTPEEIRAHIREVTQQNLDRIKDLGLKDSGRLKIPEDVNASLEAVKTRGNNLLLKENKSKMQDIVGQQSDMLQRLAEYSVSNELQGVGDTLASISDTLLETNSANLGDSIASLMNDLKDTAGILSTEASRSRSKFSADDKIAIDASKTAAETLTRQIESNEELRADLAEDKMPEERKFEELFETF